MDDEKSSPRAGENSDATARLEKLRGLVLSGKYDIPAEEIAAGVIDESLNSSSAALTRD